MSRTASGTDTLERLTVPDPLDQDVANQRTEQLGSSELLDGGDLTWEIMSLEASHGIDRDCNLEESGSDESIGRSQEDSKTSNPTKYGDSPEPEKS